MPEPEEITMSTVSYTMSMSVDGFVVGPGATTEKPLGENGEILHEWAFGGTPESAAFIERLMANTGASICGRKTYDDSLPFWDERGPTGDLRLPLFVVTHRPLVASHSDGVYHASPGVAEAIASAQAATPGKDVGIMGSSIGSQAIALGLVDEIVVSTIPILFGSGVRMFEALPKEVRLEVIEMVDTKQATHVRYRVVK
jgi:dihydrofolate reductase